MGYKLRLESPRTSRFMSLRNHVAICKQRIYKHLALFHATSEFVFTPYFVCDSKHVFLIIIFFSHLRESGMCFFFKISENKTGTGSSALQV